MGDVDCLRNKVEPFAVLFNCFGLSALFLPTPDPARQPGITPSPTRRTQSISLYSHAACALVEIWFNSGPLRLCSRRIDQGGPGHYN